MPTNNTFDPRALSRDPQEALLQFRQQYDRAPTSTEVTAWQTANRGSSGQSTTGTGSQSTTINYGSFSRDPQEAQRQFQQQYGRAPTAQEISSWQQAGASAARSSVPAPSNVQRGFGDQTQWNTIQRHALGPSNYDNTPGLQRISMQNIGQTTAPVTEQLGAMERSVDQLAAANASLLRGEIPADVSAAVRRAASETSIRGGVFGSSAQALSARDLGLTSLDIQQRGMTNQQAIIDSRAAVAQAHESIRQFNLNRNTSLGQLEVNARAQNLDAIDVERQRIATNIAANIDIMSQIAGLVSTQQQIAASAAANKIDPTNILASIDAVIAQFSARLA